MVAAAQQSDRALIEYLCRYAAKLPVTFYQVKSEVAGGRIGYLEDFSGFTFDRCEGRLREVLNRLLQPGPARYIGSTRVDRWLPELRAQNDIEFPNRKALANFWIGNATDIAAHFDSPLNLACCVSGRREFTLFAPEQVANLYIGPPTGRLPGAPSAWWTLSGPTLPVFLNSHLPWSRHRSPY